MTDRLPDLRPWPGAKPAPDPTNPGPSDRYLDHRSIAGTDVVLSVEALVAGGGTLPGVGELVLTGPDDLRALDAVVTEIEGLHRSDGPFATVDLHLLADHPADALLALPEQVADAVGFTDRRELLQLRRPLPVPADHPSRERAPVVELRPFRPSDPSVGTDDDSDVSAWLSVNNRAFAHHPDQGNQRYDDVVRLESEDWFDPDGFLVADDPDRPGRLSGFCWTKVHPATADDPVLGEIYVIGVDPSHAGEGLGASFTLAGLDHLASIGIGTAMLYVESDNAPARRLYDRLGFTTHLRRRLYSAPPR